MPKKVGVDVLSDAGPQCITLDRRLHRSRRQSRARAIQEQRVLVSRPRLEGERGPAVGQVGLQRIHRRLPEEHHPLLGAFPVDDSRSLVEVDLAHVQPD